MWKPGLWALKGKFPVSPGLGAISHRVAALNVGLLCCFWPFPKILEINLRCFMIRHLFWMSFYLFFITFFEYVFWLVCFLIFH